MYVCLLFHFPSLSLSLSIFLPSFISFIKKQFARSLLFFYLLQISPSLRAWKSSRSPCLFGPAPQNVITASRSAFVRSPSIFLHSSFIFFSFFSLFPHNLVIHIFEYLEQESRGLSYPWIVSSAQGIPFVLSSLSSPRYFSYPFRFPFSPTASIAGNRDPHARTIERWPARGFTISIVRAEGRDEKDAGFGSVSSSSSFFFPLPRCVSRLRSSFFFLFLFSERVFAIRLRDPWRFVLRAWTPRSSIDGERNR